MSGCQRGNLTPCSEGITIEAGGRSTRLVLGKLANMGIDCRPVEAVAQSLQV